MPNYKIATLTADILLKDQAFNATLNRVHGQLADLNKMMQEVGGFGGGGGGRSGFVIAIDALQLFKDAANALIAPMKFAIKTAIDLESRFIEIRKTTGLVGTALDSFKTKLGELSTTMAGAKFTELTDIAEMGGRMGVADEKLMKFTQDIGMLRVAISDIPAEESATKISRILGVFHLGTDSALSFASALARLDLASTASAREILDVTRRLSGTASVLGITPQKVLALSTALIESGVSMEVAGTSMSMVFAKMATHTQLFADVSGKSLGQFTRTLRADPMVALKEFLDGLGQLDALEQFRVLDEMKLKGQRAMATLLQLSSVMGRMPGFIKMSESEWKSQTSILDQVALQAEKTQSQIDLMKNHLLLLADQIGGYTLPILKALAIAVGDVASDVKGIFKNNDEGIKAFAGGVADASRYLSIFITDFRTVISLTKEFAIEKWMQFSTIMGRIGTDVGKNMVVGFGNAFTVIKNLFTTLGTFLGDLFTQVGLNITAQISNALTDATINFSRAMAMMMDKIPGMGGNNVRDFDKAQALAGPARWIPVPPIIPKLGGFNQAGLMGGVQAMPGFGNPLQPFLPQNPAMVPLQAKLIDALAEREAAANARRKALNPNQIQHTARERLNVDRFLEGAEELDPDQISEREAQQQLNNRARARARADRLVRAGRQKDGRREDRLLQFGPIKNPPNLNRGNIILPFDPFVKQPLPPGFGQRQPVQPLPPGFGQKRKDSPEEQKRIRELGNKKIEGVAAAALGGNNKAIGLLAATDANVSRLAEIVKHNSDRLNRIAGSVAQTAKKTILARGTS